MLADILGAELITSCGFESHHQSNLHVMQKLLEKFIAKRFQEVVRNALRYSTDLYLISDGRSPLN